MAFLTTHRIRDAFIPLGDDRIEIDLTLFIAGLLSQHWKGSQTDSIEPQIVLAEQAKGQRFSEGTFITLYAVSESQQPATVGYYHYNQESTISLDIMTSRSRQHLNKVMAECKRIIDEYRRDPFNVLELESTNIDGRAWMQWGIRIAPFDRTNTGFYRRVVDIKVNWRYRSVNREH